MLINSCLSYNNVYSKIITYAKCTVLMYINCFLNFKDFLLTSFFYFIATLLSLKNKEHNYVVTLYNFCYLATLQH